MTRLVILGGGPAGVGGAWRVAAAKKADVTLIERNDGFGGNAGTFVWNDHRLDFGSHRLHPASEPAILEDIERFLGDQLLDRPRHGRIRLLGKWVHFPLKPVDLLLHLDKRFTLGTFFDIATKVFPKPMSENENFATVLRRSLGATICKHFYFPYARKIWGADPSELSSIQAQKRVSAGSFGKLFKKIVRSVPGLKKKGMGRFYYPRQGFGAISDAYANAARSDGAEFLMKANVTALEMPVTDDTPWIVRVTTPDGPVDHETDWLWSTIPITRIATLMHPSPPTAVMKAVEAVEYRAMVLVYLELPVDRFTEFDAHYFPGEDLVMTRLSEPKNYHVRGEPSGRTVLCAEMPCNVGDATWTRSDDDLGRVIAEDLARCHLPLPAKPIAVTTRRLPQAYPIYRTGYERAFELLDQWTMALPRFLTYGRQGLFAHDNTHHALYMAYAAAECLRQDGSFDHSQWHHYRRIFASHVVED